MNDVYLPEELTYLKTESLDNAILELWLYHTMLSKCGNGTSLLKNKKLKIGCFYKVGKNSRYFVTFS